MSEQTELPGAVDELLARALPADLQHLRPALRALLSQIAGGLNAKEARDVLAADPALAAALPAFDMVVTQGSLVDLDGAQVGDVDIGTVVGGAQINITVHSGDAGASAARLADGLSALIELVGQSPAVRSTVAVFHEKLRDARGQVRELIVLKTLHDLLHGVQYQHLPLLDREARRFPDDELARASIEDCLLALRQVATQVGRMLEENEVAAQQVRWQADLGLAADDLQAALDGDESARLERAIRRLNRVVNVEPSVINTNLHAKADDLHLDRLIDSLSELYRRLATLTIPADQLSRVEAGIAGLVDLHARLDTLVHVHNDWQGIDRELRRIDATLRQDTLELEFSWPELHAQVTAVCVGEDEWARKIRQQGERLEKLLAEQRTSDLPVAFDRLQSYIGHHFFDVDTRLKQLCDKLREFHNPFDALEGALQ
jgi:hypothetical protein